MVSQSKLGKNLRVIDKKILVDEYKLFYLIKEAREEILEVFDKLEPDKKIGNRDNLTDLNDVSTIWRR